MKYACIDPRFSKLASKAWKWLPTKAGEDAAIAMGMIRWIIENQKYDAKYNYAWFTLNVLNGNLDYKGGFIKKSDYSPADTKEGQVYKVGNQSGKLTEFGVSCIRHNVKYEDSTIFSGYPAKRPWFPLASDVYQEVMPSLGDAYPYPGKALFLYMGSPVYTLPAGGPLIDILTDVKKIPLFVTFDITIGETSVFADYIIPDLTYLERWEFQGGHPNIPYKTQPIRQPAAPPLTENVKVFGEEVPLSFEAFILGLAEKMKLPGFGPDGFELGVPLTHPDHLYLKQVANVATDGKPVPDASDEEEKIFLTARKHLPKSVFDPERWKKACGSANWRKVVYVLISASDAGTVLHPPSASTIATGTEAIAASFNLDELGVTNIVDANFVESKIGDPNWVIIDGRDKAAYEKGHIPGAVNFGKTIVTTLKHPIDGRVVPPEQAAKLLGSVGISNDKKVIIYGTQKDYHVTVEMYPIYLGLPEWDYLSGGYEAWVKAGKKVETAPVKPTPATFTPNIKNQSLYVSTEQLAAIVKAKDPKVVLLDNRSTGEYTGEVVDGVRGGRIPGAINFPPEVNQDADGYFLSPEKLTELYKDLPKDKTVILYCHRGCRTGFSFLALRSLGYKDVRVYEDGFIVWGAQLDKPVENEHYANFRAQNSTVKDLQNRIKALEDQLKAKS